MPHQCTKCGEIFPDAAKELLEGCTCGSRFFYYIRQEKLEQLKDEYKSTIAELDKADKVQVEKDIRELTGMTDEPDKPVILDLESVRVLEPGKFEIDLVNLFAKNRPLIYKLEEGKYIIDLASSMKFKGDDARRKSYVSDVGSEDGDKNSEEMDEDGEGILEGGDGVEVEDESDLEVDGSDVLDEGDKEDSEEEGEDEELIDKIVGNNKGADNVE